MSLDGVAFSRLDYDGVVFSTELLKWGGTFSGLRK